MERHPSTKRLVVREWLIKRGLIIAIGGILGALGYRTLGSGATMNRRSDLPTCGAAIPTPRAFRMVWIIFRTNVSSSRRFIARIGWATLRKTGCPSWVIGNVMD